MFKDFERILINQMVSVKDALKQLDKTAEKILFVVNEKGSLIGSLSDGDIRRWILNDGTLDSMVKEACFKDTYFVNTKYNIDEVKKIMLDKKIIYVPVCNDSKQIIEFLVWDNLFEGNLSVKAVKEFELPVVVMAGGKGTRLAPFTKILPKPLFPIGDKTILEIIFDKFINYKVKNFYLSVNHKAKIIKSYFDEISPSYSIKYLYEEKPLGTIGAVKQLQKVINGNFLVTNCDIIIDTDYNDLLLHHKENNLDLTIVASIKHFNIPYGICEIGSGGILNKIIEKPEFSYLVSTGMYIMHTKVLDLIPEGKMYHITDLIEEMKKNRFKIGVFPISENSWTDTGEWEHYRNAVNKFIDNKL